MQLIAFILISCSHRVRSEKDLFNNDSIFEMVNELDLLIQSNV